MFLKVQRSIAKHGGFEKAENVLAENNLEMSRCVKKYIEIKFKKAKIDGRTNKFFKTVKNS